MKTFCLITLLLAAPALADVAAGDDSGRTPRLTHPARRIVSLSPHITENLFAIGAGDRVVGTVEFSNYPEEAKQIRADRQLRENRPRGGGGAAARPRHRLGVRQHRLAMSPG